MYLGLISSNKCTIIYINIKGVSPTHFGTILPFSGRTKWQFLKQIANDKLLFTRFFSLK
jgi:hypothetical protein